MITPTRICLLTVLLSLLSPLNECGSVSRGKATKASKAVNSVPVVSDLVNYNITRLTNCVQRDPKLIRFYVANNIQNKSSYQEVLFNDTESLKKSGLNPALPLKVLVHGYNQNITSVFPQNVKDAFLANQTTLNKNVLIADYGALANAYIYYNSLTNLDIVDCYFQAADNADRSGKRIAEFIQFLTSQNYTDLDRVHIIGHSLGSQVSGYIARYLSSFNNGRKAARLTGLDPAAPGYRPKLGDNEEMGPNDATFVDVIHTSAFFGQIGTSGQVDIFANGAVALQPTCFNLNSTEGLAVTVLDAATIGAYCSHGASGVVYSQSISDDRMVSYSYTTAGGKATVGEYLQPTTTPGSYCYFDQGNLGTDIQGCGLLNSGITPTAATTNQA